MAGPVPHLAPSGAPPEGQNTDTRISLASQLTSSVALDRPDGSASRSRIALCAGRTLRSLWPLRTLLPLCPLLPLWPRHTLQALRALRTGGALSAGFPFRPWIPPAASEHHRRAHGDGHQKRFSFRFLLLIASRVH